MGRFVMDKQKMKDEFAFERQLNTYFEGRENKSPQHSYKPMLKYFWDAGRYELEKEIEKQWASEVCNGKEKLREVNEKLQAELSQCKQERDKLKLEIENATKYLSATYGNYNDIEPMEYEPEHEMLISFNQCLEEIKDK